MGSDEIKIYHKNQKSEDEKKKKFRAKYKTRDKYHVGNTYIKLLKSLTIFHI